MRRRIVHIIGIIIFIVFGCLLIKNYVCGDEDIINENDFWIDDIIIQDVPESYIYKSMNEKSYWSNYWEKIEEGFSWENVFADLEQYKVISIAYSVRNNSALNANDIRIYPQINKLDIICYNSGNGDYFIPLAPSTQSGLKQNIVIRTNGMSDDELITVLMNQNVELTYYTGNWGYSNGHKLIGVGIHKLQAKISDLYKPMKNTKR